MIRKTDNYFLVKTTEKNIESEWRKKARADVQLNRGLSEEQKAAIYDRQRAKSEEMARKRKKEWAYLPHTWVAGRARDSRGVRFPKDEWKAIEVQARDIPVQVLKEGPTRVLLYKGDLYSTKENLKPEEARALIEEQANKKKLKIVRAKAVEAMAAGDVSQPSRRAIPREIKVAVWQRDGGRCVECGSKENLEFDHVIPVSLGGSNTERNIQLLCEPCNREKGASI